MRACSNRTRQVCSQLEVVPELCDGYNSACVLKILSSFLGFSHRSGSFAFALRACRLNSFALRALLVRKSALRMQFKKKKVSKKKRFVFGTAANAAFQPLRHSERVKRSEESRNTKSSLVEILRLRLRMTVNFWLVSAAVAAFQPASLKN